jgi:hypothetical protein
MLAFFESEDQIEILRHSTEKGEIGGFGRVRAGNLAGEAPALPTPAASSDESLGNRFYGRTAEPPARK